MLCTAYRLRHKGHKLALDTIKQGGSVGELRYRQRLIGKSPEWHIMTASFVPPSGERCIFPVLDRARLLQIRSSGLLVTGVESIPTSHGINNLKADYFRQNWWCTPCAFTRSDEQKPLKPPTKLGWRELDGIEHARR